MGFSAHFSYKAVSKLLAKNGLLSIQPKFNSHEPWNDQSRLNNWYQEDKRVWFRFPEEWVLWDMPDGFLLSETHESLLLFLHRTQC